MSEQEQSIPNHIQSEIDQLGEDWDVIWRMIRVQPVKWQLHPWGDEDDGFWVVALFGHRVIYYNAIEDGFNVSTFHQFGVIDHYVCNTDSLEECLNLIVWAMERNVPIPGFGPPQRLPWENEPESNA